jgi:ABC-type glycerol-3-phosphate transport system substrate-binding protein
MLAHFRRHLLLLTVLLPVTACAVLPGPAQTDVPLTANPSPAPSAVPTTIQAVAATPPQGPEILTLWLPDTLIPTTGDDTPDLLSEQISAFSEANENLNIEIRRKLVRETGGIMPTLQTATGVAPGVLPDLTLVRRGDLLAAVEADLVEPMEGMVSSAIVGDLFGAALDLGQVDGTLYGLPYALEIQHVVYAPSTTPFEVPSLDMYLEANVPLLLPIGSAGSLNTVFLTQYQAAVPRAVGGSTLATDEDTLLALFTFYEQAATQGILAANATTYLRPTDYQTLLDANDFGGAVVSSALYLELAATRPDLQVATIPTLDGEPATNLDGWMWVITNNNPTRQGLTRDFLNWMLDTDRQGEYVRALNLLPSQRTALRRWYDEGYASFVLSIMPNATPQYIGAANSAVARAVQTGLVAVVTGERTAEQATQDVLNQIGE